MTRELLFNTTFEPQLLAFTGWKSLVNVEGALRTSVAPSDLPGFEIIPGATTYTAYDSFGHPTNGVESFQIRIHFSAPQLSVSTVRATHSANASLLETFFSGGYAVPPVTPGDLARIDSITLLKIDPTPLRKTATRFLLTADAEYAFTLF